MYVDIWKFKKTNDIFAESKGNTNNLNEKIMKLKVKLQKGKRIITTEIYISEKTIIELLEYKASNEIMKDSEVEYYRSVGYFLKGIEDMDNEVSRETNE